MCLNSSFRVLSFPPQNGVKKKMRSCEKKEGREEEEARVRSVVRSLPLLPSFGLRSFSLSTPFPSSRLASSLLKMAIRNFPSSSSSAFVLAPEREEGKRNGSEREGEGGKKKRKTNGHSLLLSFRMPAILLLLLLHPSNR